MRLAMVVLRPQFIHTAQELDPADGGLALLGNARPYHLSLPLTKSKTYNLESTRPIIGVNAAEAHAALVDVGYYIAESSITITTTIAGKEVS